MIHVMKIEERPNPSIIEAFRVLAVATVYEASGRQRDIDCALKPLAKGMKICGPAFTVPKKKGATNKDFYTNYKVNYVKYQ